MLLPYSTDAPIYHWPLATLGTIIVNAMIFLFMAAMPEDQREWVYDHFAIVFGSWNPLQWITSNYLHADVAHVLGNMIVLWGFGIIVEGKVGWWRFLAIYNLIGILQCGVEQTMMLGASRGGSLGASAIIYGLLAIAVVWAPKNELSCVLLWRGMTTFDLPVSTYAAISLGIEALLSAGNAFAMSAVSGTFTAMSSQFLHLMGAATGFIIGTVMVKKEWVDCENWDIFSVWQNRHMLSREQLVQESLHSEEGQARLASLATAMRTKLSEYLAAGEGKAALAVHRRGQKQFGQQWQLPEDEQIQLITLLRKGQDWDDAAKLMVEYLKTPQPRETMVRAALAQILVERLNRPGQGLKVLNSLDLSSLGDKQRAACEALRQKAQRLVEDNPYEVTADW